MFLATFSCSEVSEEHERALDWTREIAVNLIHLGGPTLFSCLIIYKFCACTRLTYILLDIQFEEIENFCGSIELDTLFQIGFVLHDIDQNLEHARFVCLCHLRLNHEPKQLFCQFISLHQFPVLIRGCVS